jgi:hypothetical protein
MGFEQAQITVEKQETFAALKARIENVLSPEGIDAFMKGVMRAGFPIRQWDKLLSSGLIDKQGSNLTAKQMYADLSDSDKGLMREFYLTRIEQVPDAIREKYSKVYRYA